MNKTKKIKNRILAISIDVPAMPPKPKNAATIAITKNVTVQLNIIFSFIIYIYLLKNPLSQPTKLLQ